jgi:hypothetical protein
MKDTEPHHCTLGIDKNLIDDADGILNYLKNKGIKILDRIVFGCLQTKTMEGKSYNTDLGLHIAHRYDKTIEGTLDGVEITELLNDLILNDVKPTLQPTEITFQDLNGHRITLVRRGTNQYRVSQIDGETILKSFTRKDLVEMSKNSVCTMICEIRPNTIQLKSFNCVEITKEALEEDSK